MNELALFAGSGGGILGGQLLGWRTRCAVEIDAYCRKVLLARQKDGHLERFPVWDDIKTFDGTPWRGSIDIITGGFPCQDISVAGKRAGITGPKSSLWLEMARVIGEVRPGLVFVENTPTITSSGLDRVLSDLAQMGYDAKWCCLSAEECGAPHQRNRWWCLAADPLRQRLEGWQLPLGAEEKHTTSGNPCWWTVEPPMGRMAHGMAHRVDRLKALGNGQVPQVAAAAFNILRGEQ